MVRKNKPVVEEDGAKNLVKYISSKTNLSEKDK
jgi:hypothetical protein